MGLRRGVYRRETLQFSRNFIAGGRGEMAGVFSRRFIAGAGGVVLAWAFCGSATRPIGN
jgi:hypothetical protein